MNATIKGLCYIVAVPFTVIFKTTKDFLMLVVAIVIYNQYSPVDIVIPDQLLLGMFIGLAVYYNRVISRRFKGD